MYISRLKLESFRTFRDAEIDFLHPDQAFESLDMQPPRLPNLNLLRGDNGSGKTSLLKAVALAALGPSVGDSGIFPYRLVRREAAGKAGKEQEAHLRAQFTSHDQDGEAGVLESGVSVSRKGDL